MGIEFDDQRVDVSGVDDRRGRGVGGGVAIGGGAGVVGIIIYLVVTLLGGDPSQLQLPTAPAGQDPGQVQGETSDELKARCNTAGALEQYTDCRLIKVVNVANQAWSAEFERRGLPALTTPRLAFFTGQTQTACGAASAQMGPFYCPGDQEIYFELGFLEQLQQQFGAQGTFAQGYIAAHEYGHHLQTVLGTEPKVRAAQQRDPGNENAYSIALELQADCYAGVWANLADKLPDSGIKLSEDNIAEAVNAAQAVGDDRIQEKVQGRVTPESWTHGSAEQRRTWFLTGYRSGDMDSCNTFR